MTKPTTKAGQALVDAVRGAVLDPSVAKMLTKSGKPVLVALVSIELLERDIPAIEAEAAADAGRVLKIAAGAAADALDRAKRLEAALRRLLYPHIESGGTCDECQPALRLLGDRDDPPSMEANP